MLNFITLKEIAALRDPYYAGRWGYYQAAERLLLTIPGSEDFDPADVLEIGPYRLPLVRECVTMDGIDHLLKVDYLHDATSTPWPIPAGRFRVLVALQVWEHFDGRQRQAWQEARRVAAWAVLSVPYLWPPEAGTPDHVGISLDTLREWTGQEPIKYEIVQSGVSIHSRIVCLYDLGQPN